LAYLAFAYKVDETDAESQEALDETRERHCRENEAG
jgi:hypothetical protein